MNEKNISSPFKQMFLTHKGAVTLLVLMGILLPGVLFSQNIKQLPYQKLESRVQSIFNRSCARTGCHGGAAPQQGLSLNKKNFLAHTVNATSQERPSFDLVEPGQPDSSYLFMKITGDKDIVGAQMPLTGKKLDSSKVKAIKYWIEKMPKQTEKIVKKGSGSPKFAHPFDSWTVINAPTNRMVDKGKWLFLIAHRFDPKISSGYDQLYGLDGPANILLSMGYAFSNNSLLSLGRSRVNGSINLQYKHRFLRQTLSGSMPFSLTSRTTVNWASTATTRNRLTSDYVTYTEQLILTREIMDGFGVTLAPGITFNSNINQQGEKPLITMGIGGRLRIHRNIYLIADWNPILSGYTKNRILGNFNRFDSWGTGVEISVGGHVFQVFLTNSFGITPSQYLRGGDLDIREESLRLGFNIYRILNL